jgi:hypothetical protein
MSDRPKEPSNYDLAGIPDKVYHWIKWLYANEKALQARAEKAEAELREARMQMLSDAGQAAEAYEAQLKAEAQCDAVMKDRAQIMAERDKTFALMLERAEKAEAKVDRMREALERIAGFKGAFGFPFPEANSDYGSFAVMLARETLAGDAP